MKVGLPTEELNNKVRCKMILIKNIDIFTSLLSRGSKSKMNFKLVEKLNCVLTNSKRIEENYFSENLYRFKSTNNKMLKQKS